MRNHLSYATASCADRFGFCAVAELDMPLVHHATKTTQDLGLECLSGVHDGAFFEAQLLRAISLALSAVGFDSVNKTALEAFRAEVEMCKTLEIRCQSPSFSNTST